MTTAPVRQVNRAIMLHVSYPGRWGPGKTHASGGPYRDSLCAGHIYGERRRGRLSDVTCKRCIRILGLAAQ